VALVISSILIDGAAVPLSTVAADVTIRIGRSTYWDSFTASTCQVTLLGVTRTFVRGVTLSRPLVVNYSLNGAAPKPRFTGRTTDATLDGDALTLIAVGRLSTLDAYTVGKVAYPQERWDDRISRLFQETFGSGVLTWVGYALPPYVNARPAAPVSMAQYLDELCNMAGAIMNDTPAGKILIEEATTRTASAPTSIAPENVVYAPRWEKVLPGSNKATVPYGTSTPQAVKTAADAAAAAQYGERAMTVSPSEIAFGGPTSGSLAADVIAQRIVDRQSYPRWTTPAVTLLAGIVLPSPEIGRPVKLTSLPASAPFSPWTATVEGWTDNIVSDGETVTWGMELSLSDPFLSGVIVHVAWEDLPPTDLWSTIDPTVTWENADALAP
jgi:hypothetical protein